MLRTALPRYHYVFRYASCKTVMKPPMFLGIHGISQSAGSLALPDTEKYTATTPLHTDRVAYTRRLTRRLKVGGTLLRIRRNKAAYIHESRISR